MSPFRHARGLLALMLACIVPPCLAQPQAQSVIGDALDMARPTPHWFSVLSPFTYIAYIIDGDSGEVQASLPTSMFTPALRPALARNRIYMYGAFYTRMFFGERTDVVLEFDATTLQPVGEIEIPPKSAGLGHSGMIGLVNDRFLGIWNITPAMSVSIVDTQAGTFVQELSTPGCAAVYPLGDGFLMPCGDGSLQWIGLAADGTEASRMRSRTFYDLEADPVFDYAVPTEDGWLFMSFEGRVFEVTMDSGAIAVSEPWSILPTEADAEDAAFRISGYQPFAYNAATGLLVTLMHEGGGQETFEDPGTEIWAFNTRTKLRGYRLTLEVPADGVQLTQDDEPLMMLTHPDAALVNVHDGRTGRLMHGIDDMYGGGLLQTLTGPRP